MFREIILPIFRSTRLSLTACGIMHPRCCRPEAGGSAHTVKENAEALLVATKEIGLEVNADKTKYMVMSRDRNAGRGHSVKIDNTLLTVGEVAF